MTKIKQSNIFPKTRYQGSKYKLRDWIKNNIKDLKYETVIDAFSGTSSIGYIFKELNKTVYSNDFLHFNYEISKALIENSQEKINEEDITKILSKKDGFKYFNFIEETFKDIYYTNEENIWLDIISQNIFNLDNKYKQSMLYWALYQSCLAKRPYNLFHRKNLYVRTANVKRNFGNKTTWDKPFEEHFRKFVKEINSAIFNNKKPNKAYCCDIFDLNIEADLVYIDTPYIPSNGTLTLYSEFYHFLEGLTDYPNWKNNIDFNSKNKKFKKIYSIWEDKNNILSAFEKLIEKFKKSTLIISYRDDGIPSINEIINILLSKNKKVRIETIKYKYVLSKKESKEVLIIAE